MTDTLLRDLERRFEASPEDPGLLARLEQEFGRARRDLPWSALARVPRWRSLVDFAARFVAPLRPNDGVPSAELDRTESRLRLRLPKAVREWYRLAGRREADPPRSLAAEGAEDLVEHVRPIAHGDLKLHDGVLVLFVECDHVFRWGVLQEELALADPQVVTREDGGAPPLVWNARFSEFCWQMALHRHLYTGQGDLRTCAALPAVDDLVARVGAIYPRLPLPAWGWGASDAIVHFGDHDTVLELDTLAPELRIAAASAAALARARAAISPLAPGWYD